MSTRAIPASPVFSFTVTATTQAKTGVRELSRVPDTYSQVVHSAGRRSQTLQGLVLISHFCKEQSKMSTMKVGWLYRKHTQIFSGIDNNTA